ncbi:MAG: 2Fe-2S iron-sulfur cluster binding domain-containing protein, partial [Desulfobacterales bacterium]|nr:2Fe-2S iron-sulfur cluster binding domain-containing protein [Desulfobacterales bacterium]
MSNVTVTFLPSNVAIEVPQGESVIRAAMAAGVHINASCGGDGVCGKCRVIIEAGPVEGEPSERISDEDRAKGYCLACKTFVQGDVSVRVPVESYIDSSALQRKAPRRTASVQQIGFEEIKQQGLFLPAVEKIYVELTPPDAQDHLPDVTRLVNHLRMQHNEHGMEVELPVIRKIPKIFREQDFKVTVTLARPVRSSGKTQIIDVQAGDTTAQNYAVAMDIGTTTVFGQLVDMVSGQALAEHGEFNGQISYGEDVISRIMFAEKPGGMDTMQQVVIATVNKVIAHLLKQSKVSRENISLITFAGNTTMTQLLLAVEPRYIRRAPYVPTATVYPPIRATDLGVDLDPHVMALVYPQVSSYVGGDIVAGVMGCGMYRTEKLTLFMDIGTNA